MIISVNDKLYEVETIAYLKVFYPLEEIVVGVDEQPLFKIDVSVSTIKVAYFDGNKKPCQRVLSEEKAEIFLGLEGKAKTSKGKLYLKQMIYELCSDLTGNIPPWGVLIGIRPTKLAFKLLRELKDTSLVEGQLMDTYKVSKQKTQLLMTVVGNEMPYLNYEAPLHSIYIGIPFCPSRCTYCSFTSYSKDRFKEAFESYTALLIKELQSFKAQFKNVRSIYIGGGTPTSLEEHDFDTLLKEVRGLLGNQDIEFTVEAGRVDSITVTKLESMKRYGVNRISINPQTCHDKTLARIGRSHTFAEVEDAYRTARSMGFDHINMDVILGLPEETIEDVKKTLKVITTMKPESITVHTLALKRGTILTQERKKYLDEMSQEISGMLAATSEILSENSYHGYYLYRQKNMVGNFENVGYCLDGRESIYNIHTMEEVESIYAFGAGAISKRVRGKKIKRMDQPKDVNVYREHLDDLIDKKHVFFDV